MRWTDDVAGAFRQSLEYARTALLADPRDPQAHFAVGVGCMNIGLRDEAVRHLRDAIRLNPSHVAARANLGQMYNYLNRPAEALEELQLALALSPDDPTRYQYLPYVAASHYLAGRYRECIAACEQALALKPQYPLAVRYVVAALGQLGRVDEAGVFLPILARIDRDYGTLERMAKRLFVPVAAEHVLSGFRLAGFDRRAPPAWH